MPAPDWLEGLGGGLLGINRGLSIAMDPYKAYEGVRAQSLGNDKSDIELRNLLAQQQERENPDLNYYGNEAAGRDAINRTLLSKGNLDIYGQQQSLAANQYLSSEGFQQEVARLDPSDPEYRQKVAAAIAQYNPQAGIASYDAFKIPGMQQENLSKQAILSYVTSYARSKDPGATAEWAPDGTITVTGSDGERVTGLNPDILLRSAAMGSSKDPSAPIRADIATQTNVQKGNADVLRASLTGRETPAQMYQYNNSVRIAEQAIYNKARDDEVKLEKSNEFQLADPEKQAEMRKEAREKTKRALDNLKHTTDQMKAMGKLSEFDAEVNATQAATAGVTPQGGSSLNALPFGPRGAGAARAAGGGRSVGGPIGTGVGPMNPEQLNAYIQSLLQGQ